MIRTFLGMGARLTMLDPKIHPRNRGPDYTGLKQFKYEYYDPYTSDSEITVYFYNFPPDHDADPDGDFQTATRNLDHPLLHPNTGQPIYSSITYLFRADSFSLFDDRFAPSEHIKRFAIVPGNFGELAPEIMERVIEWSYTGNYKAKSTAPDGQFTVRGDALDKQLAIAALTLGAPDLLALSIYKLRERMEKTASELEKQGNTGGLSSLLAEDGVTPRHLALQRRLVRRPGTRDPD